MRVLLAVCRLARVAGDFAGRHFYNLPLWRETQGILVPPALFKIQLRFADQQHGSVAWGCVSSLSLSFLFSKIGMLIPTIVTLWG